MSKNCTFVLGGARSGKSGFAERLIGGPGQNRIYIATAQAFDTEMQDRITAHKNQRGSGWSTIEAPLNVPDVLGELKAGDRALLDCATLWLSNVMLDERPVALASDALLDAIAICPARLVIVSNEVGSGVVPDTRLGRAFRDAQGTLNQRLAAAADLAVLVVAGLPVVLKGRLPEDMQ